MPPAPKAAPKKEEKPAEAAPAAAEAAPAKKAEKGKKEKKHKQEKGIHAMYKVEGGDKVSKARPTCERCGPGYFMGDHHDRYTCGHCGFTRYKQK
jgi:small subunit ribosomal protein S27Ae